MHIYTQSGTQNLSRPTPLATCASLRGVKTHHHHTPLKHIPASPVTRHPPTNIHAICTQPLRSHYALNHHSFALRSIFQPPRDCRTHIAILTYLCVAVRGSSHEHTLSMPGVISGTRKTTLTPYSPPPPLPTDPAPCYLEGT